MICGNFISNKEAQITGFGKYGFKVVNIFYFQDNIKIKQIKTLNIWLLILKKEI